MIDLAPHQAVIVVFGMAECPACEGYIPRLVDKAMARGKIFHIYEPGQPIPKGKIPVLIYDAMSPDEGVQELADRYRVEATPSTLVLLRGPGSCKIEGSIDDNQIDHLLDLAVV